MKRIRAAVLAVLLLLVAAVFIYYEGATLRTVFADTFMQPATVAARELTAYEQNYYFSQLTDIQKQAYALIYQEIFDFPEEIKVPSITEEDFNAVHAALVYDDPALFFLDSVCTMVFHWNYCVYRPAYVCTKETYSAMMAAVQTARTEIYASIPDAADDYEKEKAVHDRLIARCRYEDGDWSSGIYGALVEGKAVCSGYARAAQFLLDGLGIRNYLVTGQAGSEDDRENHMWNTVFIDGNPYYLDVTWDDGDYENGSAGYAYFNVTEGALAGTHVPENPESSGCEYLDANYFVREGLYFSSCGGAYVSAFTQKLGERLAAGDTTFDTAYASAELLEEAVALLIDGQGIYDILRDAREQTGLYMQTDYINYSVDEQRCVLRLDLTENLS